MNSAGIAMSPEQTKINNDLIYGSEELAKFLTARGFRMTKGNVNALVGLGKGPPVHGRWGKFNTYLPAEVLAWAGERMYGLYRRKKAETPQKAVKDDDAPPF